MKKITLKKLKQWNACQEGINFFKNNNFEKLDWKNVKKIEGDYNNFVNWLNDKLKSTFKYDENNILNKIYKNDEIIFEIVMR